MARDDLDPLEREAIEWAEHKEAEEAKKAKKVDELAALRAERQAQQKREPPIRGQGPGRYIEAEVQQEMLWLAARDEAQRRRAIQSDRDEDEPLYFDVKAFFAGDWEPLEPTVLRRTDGHAMFYAGHINMLYGLSESGKTWIALIAVVEALDDGGTAVFLDLDHNGHQQIIPRLVSLGADPAVLSEPDRFRYVEPQDRGRLSEIVTDLIEWAPDVVVVDSVGELIPMWGASSNSADDFTAVNAEVLKPLALAGCCVICIDHLNKDRETHNTGPTGTQAKVRSAGGAMYKVTAKTAFVKGEGGSSTVHNTKDRPGGVKPFCTPTTRAHVRNAGTFVMVAEGDSLDARWESPRPEEEELSPRDKELLAWMEKAGVPADLGLNGAWDLIRHNEAKPKDLTLRKSNDLQRLRKETAS